MTDGRFEFPNVTPGQYVIQVDRGRRNPSTEGEFGALPVSVDGADITGPGAADVSRVVDRRPRDVRDISRHAERRGRDQIDITPVPIDPDLSPMRREAPTIHDDWSFEIDGINGRGGCRLQRARPEWTLKEIRVHGIDVTDRPLAFGKTDQSLADVEVVLTDRINDVSGTIVDDHAPPAPAHASIVFSDRSRSLVSGIAISAHGGRRDPMARSRWRACRAGSYYAAAVAKLPPDGDDAWQDPAYLESLVGARGDVHARRRTEAGRST